MTDPALIRAHIRSMGDYYDIDRITTEDYIKRMNYGDNAYRGMAVANHLAHYAAKVGIPEGPASFYIRQQQLSEKI